MWKYRSDQIISKKVIWEKSTYGGPEIHSNHSSQVGATVNTWCAGSGHLDFSTFCVNWVLDFYGLLVVLPSLELPFDSDKMAKQVRFCAGISCKFRMPNLANDSHSLCHNCIDYLCSVNDNCDECKDWP